MSERKNEHVIICQRVDSEKIPMPGSEIHACSKCEHDVYVAESSLRVLQKYPDAIIVCHVCINEFVEGLEEEVKFFAFNNEQLSELRKFVDGAKNN